MAWAVWGINAKFGCYSGKSFTFASHKMKGLLLILHFINASDFLIGGLPFRQPLWFIGSIK